MDFNFVQYKELAEQHKPDFWWFDGQWWFSEKEWRSQATADLIRQSNPDTLINDRLAGLGDFMTPEQVRIISDEFREVTGFAAGREKFWEALAEGE